MAQIAAQQTEIGGLAGSFERLDANGDITGRKPK